MAVQNIPSISCKTPAFCSSLFPLRFNFRALLDPGSVAPYRIPVRSSGACQHNAVRPYIIPFPAGCYPSIFRQSPGCPEIAPFLSWKLLPPSRHICVTLYPVFLALQRQPLRRRLPAVCLYVIPALGILPPSSFLSVSRACSLSVGAGSLRRRRLPGAALAFLRPCPSRLFLELGSLQPSSPRPPGAPRPAPRK